MINSVFSDGIGATLLRMRNHISSNNKYFPLDVFMREKIKKPLDVDKENAKDILDYKKGDSRIIPLMMELAKETSNVVYDEDHIWPRESLTKTSIRKLYPNISDENLKSYMFNCDRLPNIQLLSPGTNRSKKDTLYGEWLKNNPQNDVYYSSRFIPTAISYEYDNFLQFIEKRSELLEKGILEAFPKEFEDLVKRYSLQNKMG